MVTIVAEPDASTKAKGKERPAIEEVPAGTLAAEAAAQAAAPAPADPVAPARAKGGVMQWLPLAASGLAGFAAMISAIGLVVASRTTAEARHAIEALTAQQKSYFAKKDHQPAASPAMAEAHPAAPAPEHAAMSSDQGPDADGGEHATPSPAPASQAEAIADIRAAIIALRSDLARSQAGSLGLADAVRDGQTEIANRVGAISLKVDRIDRAMPRVPGAKRVEE